MNTKYVRPALFSSAILIGIACLAAVACDDSSSAVKEPNPDSGTPVVITDGGPGSDGSTNPDGGADGGDGGPSDCFTNPTTHFEIINGCTDATRLTKNPVLPLLYPDGGLPPLN